MNKIDYNKMMKEEMSRAGTGARLLLHGCCGPCSTRCLETLKDIFKVSVLFYNPNITDAAEYEKRKSEQERLLRETGWADILTAEYEPADFFAAACGLEKEREGGARCPRLLRFAPRIHRKARKRRKIRLFLHHALGIAPQKRRMAQRTGRRIRRALRRALSAFGF